jgi:hypothetical protein
MTQGEKIKKLLEVAVENGWKNDFVKYEDCQYLQHNTSLILENYRGGEDYRQVSLNDLVCNWEEGEISFIEALCKADEWNIGLYLENNAIQSDYGWIMMNNWEQVIQLWSWDNKVQKGRPTSQRLNFLFETFKHLIQWN